MKCTTGQPAIVSNFGVVHPNPGFKDPPLILQYTKRALDIFA
jgi:hypothetical protein